MGLWYDVSFNEGIVSLAGVPARVKRAEPTVLAFDIETTKQPLKFPDAASDSIMMISYMIDGQGFLITNREIISEDIDDFEYSPKDEYEGQFVIFNEADELGVIRRFFSHIQDTRPTVIATYNGDSFDFPFVEARAEYHGLNMLTEIGFAKDNDGEYKSRTTAHMDCFRWVKRDSYLPQGSQGLKAVTVAKLGYDPMELDPELMTPYAADQPQTLAQYSVSDAVATYYLYMKYVHPFIFSLCNIIPLNPDEVLRKGSGTLCETLLMVQAYKGNIVMPNRHTDPIGNTYEGHLLESETYVGGHVEALEAGVFRSDIATDFKVDPAAFQQLIDDLDKALQFSIVEESKMKREDVTNYDEVKAEIQGMLEALRDFPTMQVEPLIYHLDVAAMYPNIMLSNRLQPDAVVDEATCATCDYNRPGMKCDKKMEWAWRGEYFPAKRDEVNMIRHALTNETFPPSNPNGARRSYHDLGRNEQNALLHKRLGDYSRKVYRKTHETKTVTRETTICQRENPFYINTVRDFRDRRYEYKGLHKTWKKNLDKANIASNDGTASLADVMEAKKMIILYDSLQLAHKCILNSFYGYVMRKGARWYSMEMAGITCLTGASIIQMAKELVDRIGRPLELDTDGIWCMLPGKFPENFTFKTKSGKNLGISYPCSMLNHLVHRSFTNHQYHDLVDKETGRYEVHSENSIFFELDGPYRAMILPSSKEEDKLLKKRYAVFEHDGSLAELKGFEVKRRGELQLIKDFQKQIFEKFLLGDTLVECYAAVAKVANQWLDVLYSKGSTLHDEELIDLIAENKSMSRTLQEYGDLKSTAITTAKRLAEFLGAQMVKDKGLACKFIVSAKPFGAPVTERAVPVAIFNAEPSIKKHYLRRFLRDNALDDFDLRSILDWNYYIERFGGVIQKLITIPAAMQRVPNPVPRVRHPDWLFKRVANQEDKFKQRKLTDMFKGGKASAAAAALVVVEDEAGKAAVLPTKKALAQEVVVVEEVEAPLPDINADYSGWVRVMKKRWAKKRKERETPTGALGIVPSSMFSRRSRSLATAVWDVVQICPTSRAGEHRLWILMDKQLQSLKVRIPRIFYVNFKSLPRSGTFQDGYKVESLIRTLPRGTPCRHLYKITVAEENYLEQESHFSAMLNHPNVEGVYEMQVPLDVRALSKLGSSCAMDRKSQNKLSRALDLGFNLEDLVKASHSSYDKHQYLDSGKSIRHFFLYHASKDGRHVIGLFSPEGQLRVHIVDSARLQQLPNLATMYADRAASMKRKGIVDESLFAYHDRLKGAEVKVHITAGRAFKAIARDLSNLRQAHQGSAMLTIQSSRPQSYYEQMVGSAVTEFPILTLPSNHLDGKLPALGWQLYSARRLINSYLRSSRWIDERIKLASHFDIPLCSLSSDRDMAIFGADIDFVRRLVRQDMLLWWSQGEQPDLGGREDDSNIVSTLEEDDMGLEISRPGAYSNVTFEISLRDLAIDAVLQSGTVNDMEGSGSGSMAFDTASHNLDEYSKGTVHSSAALGDSVLTSQVFYAVKAMAKAWYVDKARGRSSASDVLADNFWRWASSNSSAMFEPAMQRFLQGLMRKTLLQLLGEFKRLGAHIVYASFTRLFLLTSKPTAGSAAAYGRYLVSAVTSRDLFKHVNMDIIHFWEYLLWMDQANFGGVICANPLAEEQEVAKSATANDHEVQMQWNIATFLPPALQPKFATAVGELIDKLFKAKRTTMVDRTPLAAAAIRQINHDGSEGSEGAKEYIDRESEHTKMAKSLLNHSLTRKLLQMVSIIQAEQHKYRPRIADDDDFHVADEVEIARWSFPNLPGRLYEARSPALEFVKTTMAVFGLAKDLSIEVGVLRRNLLDLLGIGEFSLEAEWRNPCEMPSLRLGLVICSFCNEERTMDLCRDADLMARPAGDVGSPPEWRCQNCVQPYDLHRIELRLVGLATRVLTAYALQDLRCTKCGELRGDNVAMECRSCAGPWRTEAVHRRTVVKRLNLLKQVAEYHALPLLKDAVQEMLMRC